MITWFQKRQSKRSCFIIFGLYLAFFLWSAPLVAQDFETLVSPIKDRTPEELRFFLDENGTSHLIYFSDDNIGSDEIVEMVQNNGIWSSPISTVGFKLTQNSLNDLSEDGLPNEVLEELESLKGQKFKTVQEVSEAVYQKIGEEQTVEYISLILKHVESIGLSIPNGNQQDLNDVQTLSSGRPLMLLTGDSTNYVEVFKLPDNWEELTQEEFYQILEGQGISQEDVQNLFDENQRLFYSLQTNGSWFTPLPIPGTYRATSPVLAVGDDNSALVVFAQDEDKNLDTADDFELYATVYRAGYWSEPMRLTDNDLVEFRVQIQFVNGQYVIVWVSDEDGDSTTVSDRSIHYVTLEPNGTINQAVQLIIGAQQNPQPILGRYQDQAVLLWATSPNSVEDSVRPIWESRLNESWSTPVETSLIGYEPRQGLLLEQENSLLLVYQDAGNVRSAFYNGVEWSTANPLINLGQIPLRFKEVHYQRDSSGQLLIGAIAYVPSGKPLPEDRDALSEKNNDSGVFVTTRSLLPDLTFTAINTETPLTKIGQTRQLQIVVQNQGAFLSSDFEVQLQENGVLLQTFAGSALAPGEEQQFIYSLAVTKGIIPLELQILHSGEEGNSENNEITRVFQVLPDYRVRKVSIQSNTTLVAQIEEKNGIAAPTVMVDFYLLEEGVRTLLGSQEYDPNNSEPVTLEWPEVAERQNPFRINVEVNQTRQVRESSYSNNKGAYRFNPLPDFIITHFEITSQNIYLTLKNQGNKSVSSVELMLTDDPLIAVQTSPSSTTLYNQQVSFDENNEAKLTLVRSEIASINSPTLYAIVNPYGTEEEQDRNNNSARTSAPIADTGEEEEIVALQIGEITTWCGAIQVQVSNVGTVTVVTPKMQLSTASQILVAETILPVVGIDQTEKMKFSNLQAGTYTIRLTYNALNDLQTLESQVQLNTSASSCRQIVKRELSLVSLTIKPVAPKKKNDEDDEDDDEDEDNDEDDDQDNDRKKTEKNKPDEMEISIEFSTVGFETDYKKPLIRVPLIIEVKETTELKYQEARVLFLPETGSGATYIKKLRILSSILQSGTKLIVSTPVRDDESKGSDNSVSMAIE